jgi:membrane protein insertase Oxa1/YidC/SpoIIIJ
MWVPPDVPPISTVESLLNTLHDTVHLPWWFTMCATALVVRLVMLPIMIFSLR